MSERILETQKIQGKNMVLMRDSMLEAIKMMSKQMEANTKLEKLILNKGDISDLAGLVKSIKDL